MIRIQPCRDALDAYIVCAVAIVITITVQECRDNEGTVHVRICVINFAEYEAAEIKAHAVHCHRLDAQSYCRCV